MFRVSTGIENLDDILQGGFPKPCTIGLIGEPGTGKTTFGLQFLYKGLLADKRALYITIDHAPDDLRAKMQSFGWNPEPYEKDMRLLFLDGYNSSESKEKYHLSSFENVLTEVPSLLREIAEVRRGIGTTPLVVFDSCSPILRYFDLKEAMKFFHEMHRLSRELDGIGIGILHRGAHTEETEYSFRLFGDVIIVLQQFREEGIFKRTLHVERAFMTPIKRISADYKITNEGIALF